MSYLLFFALFALEFGYSSASRASSRRGHCTPAQVALAWVLAQGTDIVPIPGTKRRKYLEQNCAALDVKLSSEEIEVLKKAFPPGVTAGTRYPEKQMKALGI